MLFIGVGDILAGTNNRSKRQLVEILDNFLLHSPWTLNTLVRKNAHLWKYSHKHIDLGLK